jgi:formate C-acetyltransferase
MNLRLQTLRERVKSRGQAAERTTPIPEVLTECEIENLSWMQRSARLTLRMCEAERPVIWGDERIVYTRTIPDVPSTFSDLEHASLTRDFTLHELGPISNICADWARFLPMGC